MADAKHTEIGIRTGLVVWKVAFCNTYRRKIDPADQESSEPEVEDIDKVDALVSSSHGLLGKPGETVIIVNTLISFWAMNCGVGPDDFASGTNEILWHIFENISVI